MRATHIIHGFRDITGDTEIPGMVLFDPDPDAAESYAITAYGWRREICSPVPVYREDLRNIDDHGNEIRF